MREHLNGDIPFTQFRRGSVPSSLDKTHESFNQYPFVKYGQEVTNKVFFSNGTFRNQKGKGSQNDLNQCKSKSKKGKQFFNNNSKDANLFHEVILSQAKISKNKQKNKPYDQTVIAKIKQNLSSQNPINPINNETFEFQKSFNSHNFQSNEHSRACHPQQKQSQVSELVMKIVENNIIPFILDRFGQIESKLTTFFEHSSKQKLSTENKIKVLSCQIEEVKKQYNIIKQQNKLLNCVINNYQKRIESIEKKSQQNHQIGSLILQSRYKNIEQEKNHDKILNDKELTDKIKSIIQNLQQEHLLKLSRLSSNSKIDIDQQINFLIKQVESIDYKFNRKVMDLKSRNNELEKQIHKIFTNIDQLNDQTNLNSQAYQNFDKMEKVINVYNQNFLQIQHRLSHLQKQQKAKATITQI